jgi:transposase-like protein
MAFSKEVPNEILKDYHGPDDFYGPEGIMKQLAKALVERAMEAELTEHPGYEAEWDKKYPMIAKSWRSRWNEVIPFFKFSPEIRKAVYTINAIESVNFTIQKIIKHLQ